VKRSLNRAAARVLRRERLQRELSQEDIADAAGIDRTYVSAIESGSRNITLNTLEALAAALDQTPTAFLLLIAAEASPSR
jgi:transcriptional regulator with XRE-family HTH domain